MRLMKQAKNCLSPPPLQLIIIEGGALNVLSKFRLCGENSMDEREV